ncbi:MAG: hypothetical protein ACKVOK_03985 [Flavobacteriales bacterium]
MKNCLSISLLFASLFISVNVFAQESVKPPSRNFLAIDIAPYVGVELHLQGYSTSNAVTFKRQINDKYRFRMLLANGNSESNYGRILHVFNDTILSFDDFRMNKKMWRSGVGVERTKRFGICEVYYGLQLHFGMDQRNFSMALNNTYGPDILEQVPMLTSSNIWSHYSNFSDTEYDIITHSQSKNVRLGLGIPIGFGLELFKHVGLQLEITPGVQLNRSLETFEYLNQTAKLEVEHITMNLDYIGFHAFLGWKF